jgi:dTDP-4-dehydrorhamnose 3,5-epimerase-like enzyme
VYKVTEEYDQSLNRGIRWDDPTLGIQWPVDDPILSDSDRNQPTFPKADNPFRDAGDR